VRITLRATNATTTNPLLKEAQASSANFFSVLSSATGQREAWTGTPGFGAAPRNGGGATNSGDEEPTQAAAEPEVQASVRETGTQGPPVSVAANTAQALSTLSRASRAPEGDTAGHTTDLNKDVKTTAPAAVAPSTPVLDSMLAAFSTAQEKPASGAAKSQPALKEADIRSQAAEVSSAPMGDRDAAALPAGSKNQSASATGASQNPGEESTDESANGNPGSAAPGANGSQAASCAAVAVQGFSAMANLPATFALPDLQSLPASNETCFAKTPAQNNGADANGPQNAPASTTPGKSAACDSANATLNAGANGAQATGQSVQHAQADGAQALTAVSAKDTAAMPAPVAAQETHTLSGASDGPRAAEAPHAPLTSPGEMPEATASAGINTARLIQTISQTEMHVGLRSVEFGDISIRTALSQQQILTQISVEHGELGRAIAAAAPGVQSKLGSEFGVQGLIEVNQNGAAHSGEYGAGSQQQPQAHARPLVTENETASFEAESVVLRTALITVDSYRLDIRA
jgi:hypothetical protein